MKFEGATMRTTGATTEDVPVWRTCFNDVNYVCSMFFNMQMKLNLHVKG